MDDDTINLWTDLRRMGNFSDKYYDTTIITDLCKELSITSSFDESLKEIPPEIFLSAFFKVMSPLISMYADILNLFERCKAKSGMENVEFEFNLKQFKSTRFNAAHFMKARQQLIKIRQIIQERILSIKNLNVLLGLQFSEGFIEKSIKDEAFLAWYNEYIYNQKDWPSVKLNFSSTIEVRTQSFLKLRIA